MKKVLITIGVIFFIIIFIALPIFFNLTPTGKAIKNNWYHAIQKADDATNYETLKKVEDTCRAMLASYESDMLIYIQYKNSDNEEKQSWAEQAKMRVNKTVSTYNNYILKNSYIWKDNIPNDISLELEYIE